MYMLDQEGNKLRVSIGWEVGQSKLLSQFSYRPFLFFFDRKRQKDILIEKRSKREGWEILPLKKTKLQEYKKQESTQ